MKFCSWRFLCCKPSFRGMRGFRRMYLNGQVYEKDIGTLHLPNFCLQQTRARDPEGHRPLLAGKLVYAKQPGIVTWECVETGFWGICWKYRRVSRWQVTITFIVLIIVFHRICGLTRTLLSIFSLHFIKYPMLCGGSRGVACLRPFLHHHN